MKRERDERPSRKEPQRRPDMPDAPAPTPPREGEPREYGVEGDEGGGGEMLPLRRRPRG